MGASSSFDGLLALTMPATDDARADVHVTPVERLIESAEVLALKHAEC